MLLKLTKNRYCIICGEKFDKEEYEEEKEIEKQIIKDIEIEKEIENKNLISNR